MLNTNPVKLTALLDTDLGDRFELATLGEEATRFLAAQSWCREIEEGYLYDGVGPICALFLFKIKPSQPDVPALIWVINGDVPAAYTDIETSPSAFDAIDGYIEEMQAWVEAVRVGADVADYSPVCYRDSTTLVEPSTEFADMLEGRLAVVAAEFLPAMDQNAPTILQ